MTDVSHCREPAEPAEPAEPEDSEFNSFGESELQLGHGGALAGLCAALDRSLAEAREAFKAHEAKAVEAAAEEPQTVYFGGKVHFFLELGCQVSTDFMSMKKKLLRAQTCHRQVGRPCFLRVFSDFHLTQFCLKS